MQKSTLRAFWIVPAHRYGPFGVTAFSLEDALRLIQDAGYSLPEAPGTLCVQEDVKISDLDASHVVPNMGPIVVRGVWYPFRKVGV